MEYISRELERKFLHMNETFKAVMVVGARQVRKSTMLKHLANNQNRSYVTMDDTQLRNLAKTDPKLFLQVYHPPVLIDDNAVHTCEFIRDLAAFNYTAV